MTTPDLEPAAGTGGAALGRDAAGRGGGAKVSGELRVAVVPSRAAQDVFEERLRQIEVEGWTPEHDDKHDLGEMADAAACYAARAHSTNENKRLPPIGRWPWALRWWKPGEPRRMLVKAGALILAEIERCDRSRIAAEGRDRGADGREGE